ncbi:MAG: TerC family protein [Deferribacterales bacterium]
MGSESIFFMEVMSKPLWAWISFFTVVIALLVIDLGLLNKKDHEIGIKESLQMSAFYIAIAVLYGLFVWYEFGHEKGFNFLNGFVVEKSLAMDNIFVIAMVFSYFKTPRKYQHRVLFWGILGVILLRGIMIGLGSALVARFEWILYIFALFLIYSGIKMFFAKDDDGDLADNKILLFLRKHLRVTDDLHGHSFFVKQNAKWFVTPLFVALCMVEIIDVVFAVDSIPAVFTITTDPFVVYTSNIFAILGLRALYFALSAMIARFYYLKFTLSLVLIFIGSKIFIDAFHIYHFSALSSLIITLSLLLSGILFSLWKTKKSN